MAFIVKSCNSTPREKAYKIMQDNSIVTASTRVASAKFTITASTDKLIVLSMADKMFTAMKTNISCLISHSPITTSTITSIITSTSRSRIITSAAMTTNWLTTPSATSISSTPQPTTIKLHPSTRLKSTKASSLMKNPL